MAYILQGNEVRSIKYFFRYIYSHVNDIHSKYTSQFKIITKPMSHLMLLYWQFNSIELNVIGFTPLPTYVIPFQKQKFQLRGY